MKSLISHQFSLILCRLVLVFYTESIQCNYSLNYFRFLHSALDPCTQNPISLSIKEILNLNPQRPQTYNRLYFQRFLLCNWLQHYSNDLSRGPSKHIAAGIFQQCKRPSVAYVACLSTAALKAKIMGRKLQMCVSICLSACVFLRMCTHVHEPYLSPCAGVQDGVRCRSLGRRWITTVLTV